MTSEVGSQILANKEVVDDAKGLVVFVQKTDVVLVLKFGQ
jgi:hypothetical protein